ncbi:MAG TPA: precorrin-4 C(11)-methyltransferase [Thermopetrobacter sp.]|nr:precorrin-4 C(11)-methyltransferase [Thermopetrobacter sp.]
MTVHFIGAGPGAADLITVRGRDLIARCPVCLYAGSLVPEEVIAAAPDDARVIDSAAMTLEDIIAEMRAAHAKGHDVARVHSGDPSIYGAIAEQMRRLDALGIPYEVVPGVPAFAAAAAALKTELTAPGVAQSIVLTRMPGKASPLPEAETLERFAACGATLAIHLSIRQLRAVCRALKPHYGPDAPIVVVARASWPDQQIVRGTITDIVEKVRAAKITRTALILAGGVIGREDFGDSALYDAAHRHLFRPR